MKVLVTGATGMLGKHVAQEANKRGWETIARSRLDFNISFPAADYEISLIKPDVIINCAGCVPSNNPKKGEDLGMILDNSVGPRRLAHIGIRLIHMSTDCVNDDTVYGRSKRLGESDLPNVLNVRGSFVCWDSGLLAWLAQNTGTIAGFTKAMWNGTTTSHMAHVLCELAEGNRSGIINVASVEPISKYTLLSRLAEELKLPVYVTRDEVYEKDRTLQPDIGVPGGEYIIRELVKQYVVCGTQ